METILICLLLLYNTWLVHYILFGRRQRNDAPAEEKPPIKPPETADDIVGKSRFKIQPKVPQATIPEPPQRLKMRMLRILPLHLPTEKTENLRHGYPMMSWTKRFPTSAWMIFRWNTRTVTRKDGYPPKG